VLLPCRHGRGSKEKFFLHSVLFPEFHGRWSFSGQLNPDPFWSFRTLCSSGGASLDGQKDLASLRAVRFKEPDEDTETLNFTTRIDLEDVRVELRSKEIPESLDFPNPTVSAIPGKRKHEKGICSQSDDERQLEVMNKVAESMTAEKCSRLGTHPKSKT
jgi:hypothetical protein